jgi:hypothetical protein
MPTSGKEFGSVQEKFIKAGIHSPQAIAVFYGLKTLLALSFLAVWMFVSRLLPQLSSQQVLFYSALAAFTGMTIPNFVLNRLVCRGARR